MSADLFAEFSEPSKSPPPNSSQPVFGQPSSQAQAQPAAPAPDPFGFLQNSSSTSAEFTQPAQQWPSFSAPSGALENWNGGKPISAAQASSPALAVEDDDWGDFETSEPKPASSISQLQQPIEWKAIQQPVQWHPPAQVIVSQEPARSSLGRASTIDLMTNGMFAAGDQAKPAPAPPSIQEEWPPVRTRPKPKQEPSDPNVLFNAEDFELDGGGDDFNDSYDDDDFGDFETVAPTSSRNLTEGKAAAKPDPPSLDLLGLSLDDSTPTPPRVPPQALSLQGPAPGLLSFGAASTGYPTAPKSPSYQQRNPFPALAVKTPVATEFDKKDVLKSASPVTAWPSFEPDEPQPSGNYKDDEDGWGAWDDMPSGSDKTYGKVDVTKAPESWDWGSVDNVQPTSTKVMHDEPPPVNVPPPSVILSIFPELLGSANQLFKPMSGQSSSIKDRILSDPKTVTFLEGYISLATTAAHVVAGRKHRWHRDKILAKSMSISAAGSKGMKLAGVDKTQSAREDREAADVVAVWRDNVGRLRSAVAAAKTSGKAGLKVPELGETMQIQTAKLVPTAPKACIICGLKREERISKVDYEVEDSFGEWWVEHWGHRGCKNFWIEHEQKLRQR